MFRKNNLLKKVLFTCIATFALPKMVFAAPDLFIQSCQRLDGSSCPAEGATLQLEAGETVKILMSVETEKKINGFSATVELENMSNFGNFSYSNIWGSDSAVNGNTFLVMRDPGSIPENEGLTKEIGSFTVTAGNTLGAAKIKFQDIDATYLDGNSVEDYDPAFIGSVLVNVVESSSQQNTNENTNTNTSGNTTNSEKSKTSETLPENPKTGVSVPLLSMFCLMSACGVSYIILRKKNYFNKI